jgi:glycosyltransferase 2 family protein
MTAETNMTPRKSGKWRLLANIALLIGLVAIFGWQVAKSWGAIKTFNWSLDWGLTGLSLVLLLICSLCDIFIWNRTLAWFTDPFPFRRAAPVYIWSFLARYIPGKVGSILLRMALATDAGRPSVPVLASSTVELALRIAAAFVVALVTWLGWGMAASQGVLIAAAITVPVVLLCAHPKIMLPVLNWALAKTGREPIQRPVRYRDVLTVFGMLLIRWVLYGASYAALATAVFPAAAAHTPALMGTACGAWAAGFVLMTPGGVGASELAQKTLLTSIGFPEPVAVIFPVLARLLTLVGEGLWSLAVIPLRASWKRDEAAK